jgi:hypothetical protein
MCAFPLAGKKPVRYNDAITPYARLVNHTERLWDYDSCAEAQLKIWLARHLIASENSGEGYRVAGWLCECRRSLSRKRCNTHSYSTSTGGCTTRCLHLIVAANPIRKCTRSQPWLPQLA